MFPTWFATKAEYDDADSIDQEKLLDGLEARTSCCYQLVPTDCINSVCGHGDHELTDPYTKEIYTRDDIPCIQYAPEPALLYHTVCNNRRSRHEAMQHALEKGLLREED